MLRHQPALLGLRDYGAAGQIGLEPDFRAYVETMVEVFRAVRRVLRADGTLWLNLGDSYCSRPSGIIGKESRLQGAFTSHDSYRDALAARSKRVPALKHKDLMLMPARVAIALQEDGWWLRQDIIWAKPNPMPESVSDRPTSAHEHLYLFARSERYFYDAAAIAEPSSPDSHARAKRGRSDHHKWADGGPGDQTIAKGSPSAGRVGRDGHKQAVSAECMDTARAHRVAGFNARWDAAEDERAAGVNPKVAKAPALIVPCILAGCPAGGTLLDPFGGSGTAALVADRFGRDAILIELNPAYVEMAKRRIERDAGLFAEVA